MLINWRKIKTGVGNASHVPDAIKNLFSQDEKIRESAYWKLDNYVVIQSDLYEAAFYIIEPIVKLLETPYSSDRLPALTILTEIATGGTGNDLLSINDNGNIVQMRLDEACQKKFKELKKRIEAIAVKTDAEKEELEFLLESFEP